MKRSSHSKLACAAGAVFCSASFLASLSPGATFTWAAAPATNVLNTAGNWNPATAPGINDEANFGPSSQTTLSLSGNMSFFSMIFAADAPAYTIGDIGGTASITTGTTAPAGGIILNNSAFTQTINTPLALRIGNINAANADIIFNGGTFNVGNNSNNNAGRNVSITGSRDVTINSQLTGTPTITGTTPNDGSTNFGQIIKNGSGTLFLTNNNNNQFFTGRITVNAGAVRANVPNAFGAHGTSGTIVLGTTRVSGGTNTGRVELTGGNAFAPETLVLEGRTVGDTHLSNFGGDNNWTGPVNLATGGDAYGISSDSGQLTISGNVTNATGTAGVRNLSFRGAANGVVTGNIVEGAGASNLSPIKDGAGMWTFAGNNTYTGATTINAGTLQIGQGGASGNLGTGNVVNNANLVFNRGDNIVVANAISGTGNVVQAGFGAVAMQGALSYQGSTTVQSGTLTIPTNKTGGGAISVSDFAALTLKSSSTTTTLAASTVTVGSSSGATLNFDLGTLGNTTVPVVNATTLAIEGSNLVNVLCSNFSVGTITLMQFGSATGGGSFTLGSLPNRVLANLFSSATKLDLNITGIDFPRWTGAVSNTWDTSTNSNPKNWVLNSNGTTPTDYIEGDSVLFNDSSTVNTIDITTTVSPNAITVNNSLRNYVFAGNGAITGPATLTKTGSGTLMIANSGNNDFTGAISVAAGGTISVGAGTTSGSVGGGTITNSGNLVLNRTDGAALANVIAGSGNVHIAASSVATLSGNSTHDGVVTVRPGAALAINHANALGSTLGNTVVQDGASLVVGGGGSITFAAEAMTIGGGGAGGTGAIHAIGSDPSVLTGPITLSSATTLSADGPSTAVLAGTVSGASDLSTSGGGTISLAADENSYANTNVNQGVLAIGNGGTTGSVGTGNITVSSSGTLSFNRSNEFTIANQISGDGGVSSDAPGTTVLTTANNFAGPVIINRGVIRAANNSAFGAGPKTIAIDSRNKGIELDGGVSIPASISYLISNDGNLTQGPVPAAIRSRTGTNTLNGDIALVVGGGNGLLAVDAGGTFIVNSNISIQVGAGGRSVALGGGGVGTVNGIISDGPTGEVMGLQVLGTGNPVWTINAANVYTGNTSLQSGTLNATNNQAFGFGIGTFVFIGSGAGAFAGVSAGVNIAADGVEIPNMLWTNRDGGGLGAGSNVQRNIGYSAPTGAGTFSGAMQINGGAVFHSTPNGTLVMSGILQNGTETFANGGRNDVFVNAAGTVTFTNANTYTGFTEIDAGTLVLAPISRDPILTGLGGADIHNGRIIMQYTGAGDNPAATIESLLTTSYSSGFTNPADRLRSLNATADRGLGWLDNGTAVVIAAAIYGDANLDRTVNISDFAVLAAHFNTPGVWKDGDFNYDDQINISDFSLLAAHFNQVLAPAELPRSSVPEPATLSLLFAGLLARRRR